MWFGQSVPPHTHTQRVAAHFRYSTVKITRSHEAQNMISFLFHLIGVWVPFFVKSTICVVPCVRYSDHCCTERPSIGRETNRSLL